MPNCIWQENDWVMLSAIEHYAYCPRQCALIHVEQVFEENIYTMRGHRLHEIVDRPEFDLAGDTRIERALPLISYQLGIYGKADVVEFAKDKIPFPVEYKHGKRKYKPCDDYQLCSQALCLEEIFNVDVNKGAIYYHSSRRRRDVHFDNALRKKTKEIIKNVRQMLHTYKLPLPVNDSRCADCSLENTCMPDIVARSKQGGIAIDLFTPLSESKELAL